MTVSSQVQTSISPRSAAGDSVDNNDSALLALTSPPVNFCYFTGTVILTTVLTVFDKIEFWMFEIFRNLSVVGRILNTLRSNRLVPRYRWTVISTQILTVFDKIIRMFEIFEIWLWLQDLTRSKKIDRFSHWVGQGWTYILSDNSEIQFVPNIYASGIDDKFRTFHVKSTNTNYLKRICIQIQEKLMNAKNIS